MFNQLNKKFSRRILALSIIPFMFSQTHALDTSKNGYGEDTPNADQTGNNYNQVGSNPYLQTHDDTNIPLGELRDLIADHQYQIHDESYIAAEASSVEIINLSTNNDTEYTVLNLEGNNVSGNSNEYTSLSNDGEFSVLVLHSNLADGVVIENTNGANAWVHGNSADNATINNSNANIYIYDNSVNGAILNNEGGLFIIHGNAADGVVIENSGTMIGSHNIATNAKLTNHQDGNMAFFGNDLSSSTILNNGTFTIGDCSVDKGCRPGFNNGTNASNISEFTNNGTLNLYGHINFENSILVSTGTINIQDLHINTQNEPIDSSGEINIIGDNNIQASIHNTGSMNINQGNTIFKQDISGSTGIINLNTGSNVWVDNISVEADRINLNQGAHLYLKKINFLGNFHADQGTIHFDVSDYQNAVNIQQSFTGKANLVVENFNGLKSNIKILTSQHSDGELKLQGTYLTSGAYEFSLQKKINESLDEWWLSNSTTTGETIYSANLGSYLANAKLANNLFNSRLEDRQGSNSLHARNTTNNKFWIRAYGGHDKFNSQSKQLKTSGDFYTTQLGYDLIRLGSQDQFDLGLMGGYTHYSGDTRSKITDKSSSSKLDGYSVGLYGTWYANPQQKTGAYLDSWVLWNDFKNKVNLSQGEQQKYDSSGITASVEIGGNYQLTEQFGIQPQAQLVYQGVRADQFQDAQHNNIHHASDNLQTRVGIKSYMNIHHNGQYQPYIALNWIHNTEENLINIENQSYAIDGYKNLGEVKFGIEANINPASRLWANLAYQRGSQSAENYIANLGLKWSF